MSKDLNAAVKALKTKYGDNVITMAKDMKNIRKIPLGIPAFDYVTTGGIPLYRITELYGDFSSLKSYFCFKAIAELQLYDWANDVPRAFTKIIAKPIKGNYIPQIKKIVLKKGYKPKGEPQAKYCVLLDVEGTYDKVWGSKLGINNDFLIYINPSSMNVTVDLMDTFLSHPDVSLVVLDSMAAIGADAETNESMEKEQMSANPRFWNKATRKMTAAMNRNPDKDITLMCINSFYDKLGMVFGNPEQVKNGKQFSLAKTMSLKTSALKTIDEKLEGGGKKTVGRNITIRNRKNKVGIPFREASFYFSFVEDGSIPEGGTDIISQLVTIALQGGIIHRKGAYYTYGGNKVNGFDNFTSYIEDNPPIYEALKDEVYSKLI